MLRNENKCEKLIIMIISSQPSPMTYIKLLNCMECFNYIGSIVTNDV